MKTDTTISLLNEVKVNWKQKWDKISSMVIETTHIVMHLKSQRETYSCITGWNQPEHILQPMIFLLGKLN